MTIAVDLGRKQQNKQTKLSQRVDSPAQLSEIDYILEAMQNLPYVDI